MGFFAGIKRWVKRIASLGRMMKDRNVSLWKKALFVFAVIYLFIPIELIPDFLLPIGFLDDIILWICVLQILKGTLDGYIGPDISRNAKKRYRGKDIIDNVEFEVKEEEDDRKDTDQSGADPGESR